MRSELYRLLLQEQELTSKYTDEHFYVQQIRERTAEARKALEAEKNSHEQVTSGPNVVYDQAQVSLLKQEPLLASLRAKAEALKTQLAEARDEVKRLNADSLQIDQLTRELKQHETNYDAYAQHLEQTRIDEALEAGRISSVNIIQPATLETKPITPKTTLVLGLGLMIALVGAISVPLVVEYRDFPLSYPRNGKHTKGVPVLATIPRFSPEQLSGNGSNGSNGKNS